MTFMFFFHLWVGISWSYKCEPNCVLHNYWPTFIKILVDRLQNIVVLLNVNYLKIQSQVCKHSQLMRYDIVCLKVMWCVNLYISIHLSRSLYTVAPKMECWQYMCYRRYVIVDIILLPRYQQVKYTPVGE